jgi:hypothetical protein
MGLYPNSPASRAVWDATDAHLSSVYDFCIVNIARRNPKDLTIHFCGVKGQALHQHYTELTYDTMDKDGNIKTHPSSQT